MINLLVHLDMLQIYKKRMYRIGVRCVARLMSRGVFAIDF